MAESTSRVNADVGLLSLAAIWGVNFSVVKTILGQLEPLGLNALRFPLACGALWLLVRRAPGPRLPDREDWGRIAALGLIGNVVYQLCFIFGIDLTLASNASLLLATTPVWTVLLSCAVGYDRPSARLILGVLVTIVGIVLVIAGRGVGIRLGSLTLRGDLLIVAGSVLWSVYTVGGLRPVAKYGYLRVTAWTLWISTPAIVVLGVPSLARTEWVELGWSTWLGVAYAGFLAIGLAYLLWYRGVERIGNSRTAVYSNLVPVAALLTAWIWLGERPTAVQLVGAGVILLGLSVARLAHSPEGSSRRWRSSGNS